MLSYLVLAVVYCNVFEGLPLRNNLDVENELVQFQHLVLWKHKAPFQLCLISYEFLKKFINILTGATPAKITQEAKDFLKGKGIYVFEEDSTYIRLYGFEGRPFLLPTF
jgi:hypothetical protein